MSVRKIADLNRSIISDCLVQMRSYYQQLRQLGAAVKSHVSMKNCLSTVNVRDMFRMHQLISETA